MADLTTPEVVELMRRAADVAEWRQAVEVERAQAVAESRVLAVRLTGAGVSKVETARLLGVTRPTVDAWLSDG